ncbi:DUF6265 family protein [Maricaulis sp. CAU 1757]
MLTLIALTLAMQTAEPAPARTPDLSAAAWLAGCWHSEGFGGTISECWTPTADGQLVGAFQLSRGGALDMSELMLIGTAGGQAGYHVKHFSADMVPWEAPEERVTFAFVSASPEQIVFDGLVLEPRGPDAYRITLRVRTPEGGTRDTLLHFERTH